MDSIPHSNLDEWVWPLPSLYDNPPVISDGFGTKKRGGKGHFGIDIMHRRRDDRWPSDHKTATGTTGYIIYHNEFAIATAEAVVKEIGTGKHGHFVRLLHKVGSDGRSLLSVYRHLQGFTAGLHIGTKVMQADPLGLVGDDPFTPNDPPHLHFELWDVSRTTKYPEACFNPVLVMRNWKILDGPRYSPHPRPPAESLIAARGLALLPKGLESI
jgi:murein DD-endopeptidase MepM/ murein hydrolase activator NlpD